MFNKNFYPTPSFVISQMLAGIDQLIIRTGKILEPSAGKGDICDWLTKIKSCRAENIDCIEIESELCSILKEKKYKIISNNFLEFVPDTFYDLIVMNPPFDNGVKHLLKAIEISDGTEIRCILNAESINNPYTAERKLLAKMIEDFEGEVHNLGNAFKFSERKTNVEVVLIKIKVPERKSKFEFERGAMNEKEYTFEEMQSSQIAQKDFFGNLEIQYNKCREIVANIMQLENELAFYSSNLSSKDAFEILKESTGRGKYRYNEFVEKLRAASWNNVMSKTKIADLVTTDVKQNFFKFQQEQGYMAFTKENMIKLIESLYYNQDEIMTNCIIEAFDLMTKYHEENRIHIEGWKTNKSWKVTKKVILPNMKDWYSSSGLRLSYQAKEKLADIEKAMCFIMKKNYENINSIEKAIHTYNKNEPMIKSSWQDVVLPNKWYDSEFFRFKAFLKGTMHLEFKDKYLYEQFNIIACKGKNWLPDMPNK